MPEHAQRLVVPSRRDRVEAAINQMLREFQRASYDAPCCFAIRLALEEALANALRHGNGEDPEKSIIVRYDVDEDRVLIEVEDEGDGFDPDAVPDPTEDENIEIPAGRGIMLMRAYMTSVSFNTAGNRVVMQYRRPD